MKLLALTTRLQDFLAFWDDHPQDWNAYTACRLSACEFCGTLGQDLELLHEIQTQADKQDAALYKLHT